MNCAVHMPCVNMYCTILSHTFLTPTHTELPTGSVSVNGTFEICSNMFHENVAIDRGAAVALPLFTAFTLRTQTVTVFRNR